MSQLSETEAILFKEYGTTLTVAELSTIMKIKQATVRNKISNETFPIPTYSSGRKRLADFRDVANYLDANRPG